MKKLKAPFVYFGGKSRVASVVWSALGRDVRHYIEPFFGSGAVLLNRPQPFKGAETVNDKDGFVCLDESTKILDADFYWRPIGECYVGQKIMAFDEFNSGPRFKRAPSGYRHWRIATVTAMRRVKKPSYRLKFNDGTSIICSEDHQWLGGKNRGLRWLTTKNWLTTISRKNQKAWVVKLLDVHKQIKDYEHGWLGGFSDGEGHYHGSAHGGGGSWGISLHQADGPIAKYAELLLKKFGYSIRSELRNNQSPKYKTMKNIHINGGMAETFRFIMETRPERLITNIKKGIEKKSIYTKKKRYVFVEKMEFLGEREVIALETDTHTFIAEGLASHNCNVWRALKSNPDEVAKWCDWPVNHADLCARRTAMLKKEPDLLKRLIEDDRYYNPRIAGYWIWAASCWIGSGLTAQNSIPKISGAGNGVHSTGTLPFMAGTNTSQISSRKSDHVYKWFRDLSARLRMVNVVCGDWHRVCGGNWQDGMGICGMFFDPPYSVDDCCEVYHHDSLTVGKDVEKWVLERGKIKSYRIVVAGYAEEYQTLVKAGWTTHAWSATGGYANAAKKKVNKNRHRETLFFSPHCIKKNSGLFAL